MKKTIILLVALLAVISSFAQNGWDAVTAEEMSALAIDDSQFNNVMARKGYKIWNNVDMPDGGFASIYTKGVTLNRYSEPASLTGKGVSNAVTARYYSNGMTVIQLCLFSKTNIDKFRKQLTDLGFKQVGREGGKTILRQAEYGVVCEIETSKLGRFNTTSFYFYAA